MDWIPVILAFSVLGVIGLIFGLVLEFADKKLKVETDPRIAQVRELVGGANCGACGFAGCDAFAEAVVEGKAKPSGCPAANAEAVGAVLGLSVEQGEKMVARVICQGHNGVATERYEYDGYKSCATAAGVAGGPKQCRFACIGLGDCARVCACGAQCHPHYTCRHEGYRALPEQRFRPRSACRLHEGVHCLPALRKDLQIRRDHG